MPKSKPVGLVIKPATGWNETFGSAYAHLKAGGRAGRAGWNCSSTWIEINPSSTEMIRRNADGTRESWVPDADDLIENDWHILPPLTKEIAP
jgi:hypothetical protein